MRRLVAWSAPSRRWRVLEGALGFDAAAPGAGVELAERWHFRCVEIFLLGHAIYWAWSWGSRIVQTPAIISATGLARDVDLSFLMGSALAWCNAALISACAVALGVWQRRARALWPPLLLLLHLQYVARHCLGKTAHGSHYVGLGLLALALSDACCSAPRDRRRFALGGTLASMGVGYVCAGLSKLYAGGWRWPDGRHLWLWIAEKQLDSLSEFGASRLNLLQRLCLAHWGLATGLLSLGLSLELGGFLLWFPRTRSAATLALIGLHLGVYFSLGILFDTYIYQLALLGLPWPRWFGSKLASEPRWLRPLLGPR